MWTVGPAWHGRRQNAGSRSPTARRRSTRQAIATATAAVTIWGIHAPNRTEAFAISKRGHTKHVIGEVHAAEHKLASFRLPFAGRRARSR